MKEESRIINEENAAITEYRKAVAKENEERLSLEIKLST